ncbi:MAG: ABC transporter permease subunit [Pirellulaceae bacterium]|nr:ABC transporter permease subunit [Pirellulaceae bacterium]
MNYLELSRAIGNSLLICLACIAVAVPIGTGLAVLLMRTNIYGRRALAIAIGSQLAVPLYVFAGSWNAGFGSQGWWPLAQVLAVKFDSAALFAVIFIHSVAAIPWVCLITWCGLMWSQRSLEESALSEAGNRAVLLRVILPGLQPWLLLSSFWVCVPILTEMVITNLYQVPTVAERVYLDASRGTISPLTYPVAVALCMLPVVSLALLLTRRLPPWSEMIARARQHSPVVLTWNSTNSRVTEAESRSAGTRGGAPYWRIILSLGCWSLLLLLVYLPIANLIVKAGWQPYIDADSVTRYGWSLGRFLVTLRESLTLFLPEFYWSAVLAVTAASVAILSAAGLVKLAGQGWLRWIVGGLMLALIGTPGALVGMLCISLMNRSEPAILGQMYDQTLAAPVLAQQFRLLPLAWLFVQGIVASIDQRSWELAKLEGLSRWQRIRTLVLPQTGSLWLVAWLILMLVSVGELSTTILVLPPGVTTLSMRLFEMLHFGMRHQDSGLCLVLVLLGWIAAFACWKTLFRSHPQSN